MKQSETKPARLTPGREKMLRSLADAYAYTTGDGPVHELFAEIDALREGLRACEAGRRRAERELRAKLKTVLP